MTRRSRKKNSKSKGEKSMSKYLEKGEISCCSHNENVCTDTDCLKGSKRVQPEIADHTLRNNYLRTASGVDVQSSHQMKNTKQSQ